MKVKPTKKAGRVVVELDRSDERMMARPSSEFSIRNILVPIDFSDCSRKALKYAAPFARQFGASITLVYVAQLNYQVSEFGAVDFPMLEKEMLDAGRKELETLGEAEVGAAAPYKVVVRPGRPVHEIARVARETNADLIIIATHGHTGIKHVLLGSVTENVVRYAPCPVLTVRENEREFVK